MPGTGDYCAASALTGIVLRPDVVGFGVLAPQSMNFRPREKANLMGGHFVPAEDIRRRYYRSLDNLREILPKTNAALLFDNLGKGHVEVAKSEEGVLTWRADDPPGWLGRVLDGP